MGTTLNDTPRSERLHIGLFGMRNAGKSSLTNILTGHETAIVSDTPGTTTDPVFKSMEIHGLGPCVIIDTAGLDDEGEIGQLRIDKTKQALEKSDIIIYVLAEKPSPSDIQYLSEIKNGKKPYLIALNKCDILSENDQHYIAEFCETNYKKSPILLSAISKQNRQILIEELLRIVPPQWGAKTITKNLCAENDVVLLVMPQDIQAPQGRLILPQVQVLRDLLDKKCSPVCCTTDKLEHTLSQLKNPPALIITDSQVFSEVWKQKPEESRLTSFSILMAEYKGDIQSFIEGSKALDTMTEQSRVLIAEACTHAPLTEDIGREKIPNRLRKLFGKNLQIDMVSGSDFPSDLTQYSLIIHCGGCMFNRTYMLSRIQKAKEQGVPISNYGVILAKLAGILDKVDIPY